MKVFSLQLVFCGIVTVIASSAAASGCPHLYYNPLALERSIAIYEDREAIIFGGLGSRVSFCDSSSSFICIEGEEFLFAFPKNVTEYPGGWDYSDATFQILDSAPYYKSSGEEVIYIVESKRANSDVVRLFSFSYRSGLLAIGRRDKSGVNIVDEVYIEGGIGYGADRNLPEKCTG